MGSDERPAERGLWARARAHLMDLTPLRESRDFRLLFLGKSVSDFGDEIVATVVPFQVYQLTHSTLAVGLLGLCELVPVFVFPILGGAFADAVERRRFVIVMHAILAVMSAFMALNATLEKPLLWPLYVFATLSAGLYTFNRPASPPGQPGSSRPACCRRRTPSRPGSTRSPRWPGRCSPAS
jgi:Na+/melibiose symporter-like transporter